ncbi:conserved hypothetical protein [Xenorhabdus cabanillasii JM26]|uniref:Uncharacterized protein n=1 Tax=Xenorhabdus cabanillasii JM26 TaxID=1427517 RepID=W1IPS1_9GAMM|nr:conserved hypothetical protein [Xenorhabdus cabanillasii JM26]
MDKRENVINTCLILLVMDFFIVIYAIVYNLINNSDLINKIQKSLL